MYKTKKAVIGISLAIISILLSGLNCSPGNVPKSSLIPTVPHRDKWGIYELGLADGVTKLIYSTPDEIQASALRLDRQGNRLLFAQKINGVADENSEICTVDVDGTNFTRLTDNTFWDLYPAWSPDASQVAFLSRREKDLDLYLMDIASSRTRKLLDSGDNDADIDWAGGNIVFTSGFAIWKTDAAGINPVQVTNMPGRGTWGQANLPLGDYDPRLSPDGSKIVFERLEDAGRPNGGYNFFVINTDGTGETRLTDNNYAQGLASWSHSGDKLVYIVAAIDGAGKYDIYLMNSDGTENRDITPQYFPAGFLCHAPVFSQDDSAVFFIGQWW